MRKRNIELFIGKVLVGNRPQCKLYINFEFFIIMQSTRNLCIQYKLFINGLTLTFWSCHLPVLSFTFFHFSFPYLLFLLSFSPRFFFLSSFLFFLRADLPWKASAPTCNLEWSCSPLPAHLATIRSSFFSSEEIVFSLEADS